MVRNLNIFVNVPEISRKNRNIDIQQETDSDPGGQDRTNKTLFSPT